MSKQSKRISGFANSLKRLGEVQVTDWDFDGLLHKDVREIEFAKSLRKLGGIRVMEWDFRTVLPAVGKLAHQEVDFVELFKRVADYKVMEWDFRTGLSSGSKAGQRPQDEAGEPRLSSGERQELMIRLKDFLQFIVVNLIDEPNHAQIRVREIAPNVLRYKIVLVQRDVSILIGTGGHTAGAIRGLLKAAAGNSGVKVLLQIRSHEQEIVVEGDSSEED